MKIQDIRKRLGFKKGLGDVNLRLYMPLHASVASLPPRVDLRAVCPPVLDQGDLGRCTANALASMFRFVLKKQKCRDFAPSRLFIYYNEREMEGTTGSDAGAVISDGIKSMNEKGVCAESLWKYDIKKFTRKPSDKCYNEALHHQTIREFKVNQNLFDLKACLADGFPFVCGFSVYQQSIQSALQNGGKVEYPTPTDVLEGGHAVMFVGYDDETESFYFQNSWGKSVGDQGFFRLPYSYLTNLDLASDFRTIRMVEG